MKWALVIAVVLAGCNTDLDEPWELAHDRIIAVRANPPRILPGEQATLELLLGFEEQPVTQRAPDFAAVVSPQSLKDTVKPDAGQWVVTAPTEDQLAAARVELELEPGAPVPLQIGVGVKTQSTYRITEQGDLSVTDNTLDVAIQGKGYFRVEMPDGTTAYTRSGSLQLSANGEIVTQDGYRAFYGGTVDAIRAFLDGKPVRVIG